VVEASAVERTPDQQRPRLLVVDDDEANLRTFQRVFRREYEVEVAASGEAALERLAHGTFDVALVDYAMPGMNGVELLRRMADAFPQTGRLMLTAHADLPEVAATESTGLAVMVLMKPWEKADVQRAVQRAMQLAAMRKAVERMRAKVGPSS
jgi:CheY-like chemotaxis protein